MTKFPFSNKKLASLVLAAFVATSAQTVWAMPAQQPSAMPKAAAAAAAVTQADFRILVNGKQVETADAKPYIDPTNNRTMVPIRFVSEALGANVEWNAGEQTVKVTQGDSSFTLKIDNTTADVLGKQVVLDAKPVIKSGRTFVPLRFISEAVGAKVDWNPKERLITINRDDKKSNSGSDTTSDDVEGPLTLNDAVQLALQNNSDLKALRIDADSADTNARLVNAKLRDIPVDAIGSLDMAQQKYVTNAKAAMAKKVNDLYVKSTEHKVELGAQKAYYDLLNAEADLKLKQQGVSRAETQKKVADAAFKVGTKAKTDVLQADAALAGAQAALAVAENNVKVSRMKLNDFIGVDLQNGYSLTPEKLNTDDLNISLQDAIALAQKQRVEIQQKQEELKVAELNVQLISDYSSIATYQGKMAKDEVQKANLAIDDAKTNVAMEVSQAYYNLQTAKSAMTANQTALKSAQENYRLTNLRYANGMATTLDVIQAAEDLANRENQSQTSIYNYNLAVVNFQNSLGN